MDHPSAPNAGLRRLTHEQAREEQRQYRSGKTMAERPAAGRT
jgi:hypothetical protein